VSGGLEGYDGYECLSFDRHDGVLVVSIDQGNNLNLLDGRLHRELGTVFADIRADTASRAVVLTGNGQSFCAGGDLRWMQGVTPAERDGLFAEARATVVDLLELPQPIIAAVNGPALGLGATVALLCDIVIAAEDAVFGDPHVRIGLVAGDGGAVIWPWLVGMARAKEYLFTGDPVPAPEAERIGLINRVVPGADVLPAALELAARLASGATAAIQGTKASMNKILRDTANLVLDTSLAVERHTMATDDHREALAAFLEKREPKFRGA